MTNESSVLVKRPRLGVARYVPVLRGRRMLPLWVGVAMFGSVVIGAVCAPWIATYSPDSIDINSILSAPSTGHLFGTDQFGRDIFARTLFAARLDILLALALVATGFLIGTTLGMLGGWRGGGPDSLLTRVIDVALAFPFLVLVLSVVGMRGPGLVSLYIAVSLVSWVFYARLVREEVRTAKQSEYMQVAMASDFSNRRVLIRHLLPNVIVQPVVYASSDCTYALLIAASVSFLGAGVQPPQAEWGQMIAEGTQFLPAQWWISTFPALFILWTSISFALVSDGLAELFRTGDRR